MTKVLAFSDQHKIASAPQRRFAIAGAQTPSEWGAALDRNGLSVSTETACRFPPKSPVGNSEICIDEEELADWRAGRNAVYQLAALTIGARLAVTDG